jgi:hypothetical protein
VADIGGCVDRSKTTTRLVETRASVMGRLDRRTKER